MVFLGKPEFVSISFDMRFDRCFELTGFCRLIEEGFSFCLLCSGLWLECDEPESLILAQSERWRHA
jgi:hypothetical protein